MKKGLKEDYKRGNKRREEKIYMENGKEIKGDTEKREVEE